jgi:GNAT superfamily N-acetyltransferase
VARTIRDVPQVRALRGDDVPSVVRLIDRVTEDWLDWPRADPDDLLQMAALGHSGGTWVAESREGVVGYAQVRAVDPERRHLWVDIRTTGAPGAADRLLDATLAAATHRASKVDGVVLRSNVETRQADVRAAFLAKGFQIVTRPVRMLATLGSAPVPLEFPAGVTARRFENRDAPEVYRVVTEALRDSGSLDYEPPPYVDWYLSEIERSTFRPDLSFVALYEGAIVGAAIAGVAGNDSSVGWYSVLSVRREWRGRGLGKALLNQVMRAFVEAGYHRIGCGTDLLNPTSPHRIATAAGFQIAHEFEAMERRIDSPGRARRMWMKLMRRIGR